MNRMKKYGCLLVLILTVGLSAGCGKNVSEEKPEKTDQTEMEKTEETGKKQPQGDEFFPLQEKMEFSLWTLDNATMTPGYEATDTARLVEEATNVHLNVTWVTIKEAQEKFGLMIASGDIPDMVYAGTAFYPGGAIQGVQDGLFQETTDLIERYMPHYQDLLAQNEDLEKGVTSDDGKRYSIYSIYVDDDMKVTANLNMIGLAIRRDWLIESGLEMPVTMDDWTETLTCFRDMGIEAPLMIGSNGRLESGAFLSAYGVLEGFYMEGDTVKYGPTEEGYRQYLLQMKEWYERGLIDPNFAANNRYVMLETDDMAGNRAAAGQIWWQFGARELVNLGYPVSEDFYFAYAPHPVLHIGDKPQSAVPKRMVGSQLCINAEVTGARLETLCRYIDYHYTRESMLYHNYGEEGVHYDVAENGQIFYSDRMTEDPENNVTWMRIQHLSNGVIAGAESIGVNYASYPDGEGTECLDMQSVWNTATDLVYPAYATMTAEETAEFNTIYTAIETLVDEMSCKFIMGIESMDQYDAFVERLYQYGIQECIDQKQKAYDRYMRR